MGSISVNHGAAGLGLALGGGGGGGLGVGEDAQQELRNRIEALANFKTFKQARGGRPEEGGVGGRGACHHPVATWRMACKQARGLRQAGWGGGQDLNAC